MTWDASVPSGTDLARSGDDVIRELKADIALALTEEGDFPVDTANPKFYYRGTKGATGARPTRGGFFFDETKGQLQRDTGAAWEVVGYLIPAGTKTLYYQASAPTGWTRDTTSANDKFLRVVTAGTPGSNGGTHAASINIGTHTHAGPSHTHAIAEYRSSGSGGMYFFPSGSYGSLTARWSVQKQANQYTSGSGNNSCFTNNNLNTFSDGQDAYSDASGTGNTGASSIGSGSYAYADVMIAAKDAY